MTHLISILGYIPDSLTTEAKDLFDLQSKFGIKVLLKKALYTGFWVRLLNVPEYRRMAEKAIFILIQMPTTCLCKNGFSCVSEIKFRKRNSITYINSLMKGGIEKVIIPRLQSLVGNMQQEKNH